MTPTGTDPDSENLTRKQRRDQAREQRRAQEQSQAATAARRRRLMQLGGVAAVVIVAIVVIIVATNGSKSPSEAGTVPKTTSAKNENIKAVEALLNGIPQQATILGNAKAPVTLQYFGDLECPICREFTLGALPGIIQNDVRSGRLKIEYRSFSTATGNAEHSGAEPSGIFRTQQVAANAAGRQNKAWYYIELFYHEQGEEDSGYVTESFIKGLAEQVPGLDLARWEQDRGDSALLDKVLADEKAAAEIGFKGTPSFMLGKSGGTLKPFSPSSLEQSSEFETAIGKLA